MSGSIYFLRLVAWCLHWYGWGGGSLLTGLLNFSSDINTPRVVWCPFIISSRYQVCRLHSHHRNVEWLSVLAYNKSQRCYIIGLVTQPFWAYYKSRSVTAMLTLDSEQCLYSNHGTTYFLGPNVCCCYSSMKSLPGWITSHAGRKPLHICISIRTTTHIACQLLWQFHCKSK